MIDSTGADGSGHQSVSRDGPSTGYDADPASVAVIEDRRFRILAENLPVLCWMANADGYIYWYNQRWHDYCGSTPAAMEGWGWKTVHDPAVLPSVLARWEASIASGEPFEMTFPLRGADGVFRPFLTRIRPIRDDAGTLTHWFGVNIDVSAQVEAETRLHVKRSRLEAAAAEREALLRQLSEGVIVTDPEGRITFVNEAAARLHGVVRLDVAPEDYPATYSLFTMDGEPHPADTLPLARAVRDGETVIDAHWRIRRPDGTDVLAVGSAQPFYAEDGTRLGAVLVIHDDTARFAARQALAEALTAKEFLLQEVNHRVKNSLQLVMSLLMLPATKDSSAEVNQVLTDASRRVSIVADMHRRLYDTGRHDRVEICQYLSELAGQTVTSLDHGGRVRLALDCPGDVIVPVDHAVPLGLAVSELLTNALKYAFAGRAGGTIALSVHSDGKRITIGVCDDGNGLPDDFDLATAPGLGMRLVTALTEQTGGGVTIEPAAQGTAFRITLPATPAAD